MQAMGDLPGFDPAFNALRGFLGQVVRKIRDVHEVEVSTAKRAMSVTLNYVLCGATELRARFFHRNFCLCRGYLVSLVHVLPPCRGPSVVVDRAGPIEPRLHETFRTHLDSSKREKFAQKQSR
ncbi:MAG: hypothetical protein A2X94_15980 [Bdellovibrionales bacterium GWB1_55_8]|nr:MAG: hypothetical protein A2X94_15980 [Bdellovibrionales bacterium GWB1_55_8]